MTDTSPDDRLTGRIHQALIAYHAGEAPTDSGASRPLDISPAATYNPAMIALASARERHVAALGRNLTSLVAQLRALPAVQRVILFGSYAAGRRDLFTDLDLLVVMDSPLDFVSRAASLAQQLYIDVPVDLLVYTPQEMARMRGRPFMRHALATGKVLYERGSKD